MINKKYGISASQISIYGFKLCLEVYEKYNRKCSECGSQDYLAIHHIDRSGQSDNPNNSLENLQLICRRCHSSLHSRQRWDALGINRHIGTLLDKKVYLKIYRREWMKENRIKRNKYMKKYMKEFYKKHRSPEELEKRRNYMREYRKMRKLSHKKDD